MSALVFAVVLAAGASSRMGAQNKLLCELGGEAMILRAVRAAAQSRCTGVIVVTGCDAPLVEALLASSGARLVRNAAYMDGMAGSIRCGLLSVPADADAAVILLADMPGVEVAHVNRVIDAFDPGAPAIVVPVRDGRRGHPVLWPRGFFPLLLQLQGDVGARELLQRHADRVRTVSFDTDAIFMDVDTPQQLSMARQRRN